MEGYKFKVPNLVEVLLFVALTFIIVFGFWILVKVFGFPFELIQTATAAIDSVFLWLALIILGVIAIELESIREHVRNIDEKLRENK